MYRFFLLFCFISGINSYYNAKGLSHNISQDFVRDTIYTTFEKYDRTVVRYENKIVNHIKRKVVIIAKDRNNICKSEILFVGSILNSDNDTISFLKKEDIFGLKESPHSSGNIIVYKNRIRQGYYSNFSKGFFVKVEDNILHIKDVMEEGTDIFAYTMWSPFDIVSGNSCEMEKRYGLIYVDIDNEGNGTGKCIPKDSFYWYARLIKSNAENL